MMLVIVSLLIGLSTCHVLLGLLHKLSNVSSKVNSFPNNLRLSHNNIKRSF